MKKRKMDFEGGENERLKRKKIDFLQNQMFDFDFLFLYLLLHFRIDGYKTRIGKWVKSTFYFANCEVKRKSWN